MKFFSPNIICKQHIINWKQHFFTLVSKYMVVQEFLDEGYERNNLYTKNKDLKR